MSFPYFFHLKYLFKKEPFSEAYQGKIILLKEIFSPIFASLPPESLLLVAYASETLCANLLQMIWSKALCAKLLH